MREGGRPGVTQHLMHVFPAFELGGAQARTAAWMNALGPAFRHTIVSINGRLDCRARLDPSLDVKFPAAPGAGMSLVPRVDAYRRFIRDAAPDVLLTNNWGSIEWTLAGRLAGGCRLLHVESGFASDEASSDYRRRALIRRLVLSGRVGTVVPSRTLLGRAVSSWGLNPRKVHLVMDGIDTARFASAAQRRPDRPVLTIGTVAVLREEKRLDLLIEAFARLLTDMPARLVIVGDGAQRPGLEAQAGRLQLGGHVQFTGAADAVEFIYPRFDIFALSSSTEQIPNSVLEAMAAGLPVAATAAGDVPLMVADENRPFVVPLGDVSRLAEALAVLGRDPGLRAAVGAANQRKAQARFDQAGMVEAYRTLLSA
jgi:glycosyltransferase involved in cell wall biosynthesis